MNEIASGVAHLPILFVNTYFVDVPGGDWVLVDTGLPGFAQKIRDKAAERYGSQSRPRAIVLTHGHIDHASNARELAEAWDVPVYAHSLELPYLDGRSDYPPKDPTVGGAIAFAARFMTDKRQDIGPHLQPLPDEMTFLPDWEVHFTPGHSPGHISLFRSSDRTLLAGDAIATADFDSWLKMMTQVPEISRAGTPFNCDWDATRNSAKRLAALRPFSIGCGHGVPMTGSDMAEELEIFATQFPVPEHGRYVDEAAMTNENGVVSLPPAPPDALPKIAAGALGLIALTLLRRRRKRAQSTLDDKYAAVEI